MNKAIVIATIRPWHIDNAQRLQQTWAKERPVFLITDPKELTVSQLQEWNPQYVFFPHWSWKIPASIHEQFECVLFHMTDLPYGRGGSPLQNLIQRKIYHTKISAIKVVRQLDAGPIYLKRDLYLGLGSAEEIFITMSEIIFFDMIPYIIQHHPQPIPQSGDPVTFQRRNPAQSLLPTHEMHSLRDLYDFIRMLDAEGYPPAYLEWNGFRFTFSNAHLRHNHLEGHFKVTQTP